MKKVVLLISVFFLIVTMAPSACLAAQETRTALVIGNSYYTAAPLRNPANDATDMASALKKLGFSVTLKTNANQRAMEEAIRAFGTMLRSGGVGLFYFAGHGLQYRGTNYLIPVHAEIKSESDVKFEAVDTGRVLAQMEDAGNNLNIIILDACRNNPFVRSFRSSEQGLARMDAPTGSILAYSTAPGSVAADGTGKNGLYTEKLLKEMMKPGLDLNHLFMNVRKDVVKTTDMQQVPWESSSLIGDFYFLSERGIVVSSKSPNNDLFAERQKIEKERMELKRLKKEIEEQRREVERRRIETEKQKEPPNEPQKVSSIEPTTTKPMVIRDRHFERYASGVVYDHSTGLEWYVGPQFGLSWDKARAWVAGVVVAGGDWRMPTRKELKTLYDEDVGERNMTPLLENTGWGIWSGDKKFLTSKHWYFNYITGSSKLVHVPLQFQPMTFAVRSRKGATR